MKKMLCLFSFSFLLFSLIAQEAEIQKEVDEQVWKPFVKAYSSFDATTFNSLHSEDVIRANAWGVRVGKAYLESNIKNFQKGKERGDKRSISFWFEHRKYSGDVGYEVGYYEVKAIRKGEEKKYYARFHIVLRKIDGKWKIVQDWDTSKINGVDVTQADYLKKEPEIF